MTNLWCPFAVRQPVPGHENGAGGFLGTPGGARVLHHTTEGSTYAGAFATYRHTGSLSHFTDTFEGGNYVAHQHLPLNVGATALVHPSGSGQTNRDPVVIQIEHVGTAATSIHWAAGYLDGIGRLCRWIEKQIGCPAESSVSFVKPVRMNWAAWHAYSGHLGHVHAPFNFHIDPGPFDINRILAVGSTPPAPPPAVIDFPEEHMHRVDLKADHMDDQGNGWFTVPNTEAMKVVSVVAHGSYPPDDGYWNLPVFGRQQRGADTIIQISEMDARAPADLSVWVAD